MQTNFVKTQPKVSHLSEEKRGRIKKRGKMVRGGGVKGKFRDTANDSFVNQERYFAGV